MELLEVVILYHSERVSWNHVAAAPRCGLPLGAGPVFEPHLLNPTPVAVSRIEPEVLEGNQNPATDIDHFPVESFRLPHQFAQRCPDRLIRSVHRSLQRRGSKSEFAILLRPGCRRNFGTRWEYERHSQHDESRSHCFEHCCHDFIPWAQQASGSCHRENLSKRCGNLLAMVNAVGGNAQSQSTYGGYCGFACCAIRHHPRHRLDVGPPAAVVLSPHNDWNRFYCDRLHLAFIIPQRDAMERRT